MAVTSGRSCRNGLSTCGWVEGDTRVWGARQGKFQSPGGRSLSGGGDGPTTLERGEGGCRPLRVERGSLPKLSRKGVRRCPQGGCGCQGSVTVGVKVQLPCLLLETIQGGRGVPGTSPWVAEEWDLLQVRGLALYQVTSISFNRRSVSRWGRGGHTCVLERQEQ